MIRFRLSFILVTSASFVYAFTVGGLLPYLLFYTLFSIGIIEYFYMQLVKAFLYVKVRVEEKYFSAGDSAYCVTEINSDASFPIPYVEIRGESVLNGSNICAELVTLTMEENSWINREIKFSTRGLYDLGSITLKAQDIFNFITYTRQIDLKRRIKVYPKIYDIQRLFGGGKDIHLDTIDRQSTNEDLYTIKDVRKYRNGDSLKKVHWKLSAKYNELFVKNSDNISGEEVNLFIDMRKSNYELEFSGIVEERIIDVSMSIVNYICRKDICINIYTNAISASTFQVKGQEDFNTLMEIMIETKSDGIITIEEFIDLYSHKLQRMNKIIVVVAALEEAFIKNIMALKSKGYNSTVIYCCEDEQSLQFKDLLKKWGISCLRYDNLIKNPLEEL